MQELRWEFSIGKAMARIALGIVILIEGLIALDFIVYIGAMGCTFGNEVVAAYDDDYDRGYIQTYDSGYQEAYSETYIRGYEKGYEIGLETGPVGEVATRVELHNPTYEEMMEFLARDDTDSNDYIKGEYVCRDFAADVNNNAEREGIRTAYVRIRSEGWGHAIVAFQTVDKGLLFIEPMSDTAVRPAVDKTYWWLVRGTRPEYHRARVLEMQIIW